MRPFLPSCLAWAIVLGLTFAEPTNAQPGARNVPSAVQSAYAARFGPVGPTTNWDRERDNIWQATFRLPDGTAASARFDGEGNWLETSRRVSTNQLPADTRSYVLTQYPKKKIRGAALVTRADDLQFWKINIDGQRLLFDYTGHFLRTAPPHGPVVARNSPRREKKTVDIPADQVDAAPAASQAGR